MSKKNRKPRKIGRPTKYTPALADKICRHVMDGLSLRSVVKQPSMPGLRSLFTWMLNKELGFSHQYAQAKEAQVEMKVDGILELAASATPKNAHVIRLQVDTLKWAAEKLLPKKYGDRRTVRVEGHITHTHELVPSLQGLMLPYQADVVDVEALPEPEDHNEDPSQTGPTSKPR